MIIAGQGTSHVLAAIGRFQRAKFKFGSIDMISSAVQKSTFTEGAFKIGQDALMRYLRSKTCHLLHPKPKDLTPMDRRCLNAIIYEAGGDVHALAILKTINLQKRTFPSIFELIAATRVLYNSLLHAIGWSNIVSFADVMLVINCSSYSYCRVCFLNRNEESRWIGGKQ